jgi:demethylmenaquinone methyltransferase / 2-methoxy-6-polyprenyl-1,4-benzoquinol methylase
MQNSPDTQQNIIKMFDDIAPTYDVANRVLSMGLDVVWRKKACDLAFEAYGKLNLEMIVDVACGTGDMISHWNTQAKSNTITLQSITGIDPSAGMLEVAQKKLQHVCFAQAEAQKLPLQSHSVDILSIAYGIRNVVARLEAFHEFYRVLKPEGVVLILEFTKNEKETFMSHMSDMYIRKILPLIGGIISRNYKAYRYLPSSIESFLTRSMLEKELCESGFKIHHSKESMANISTLLIAKKGK